MARVAIVIITYNSASEIGGCLDALTASLDVEVVVVDNASADRTVEEIARRGVRVISNRSNAGFAAGVNQGVLATTAPLVLLLNPDAHLVTGLEAMANLLETPGTGAVGGMLVGIDDKPQRGFMARNLPTPLTLIFEVFGINHLWPRNPLNWHYRCLGFDPMTTAAVDQPAGAFLMFRRAVWEQVGGFDERFAPIWFEDVDFCARIKTAGFRTYYEPAGVAKHSGSHSIRPLSLENRQRYWYGSLLEYAAKHYRSVAFRTTCVAVAASAALRAVIAFPREGFKAFAVYGGVFSLALGRFFRRRARVVQVQ
jgi:N-acetylglucosaminyl-diphospho-decaprenol L-rhamnosyltransferase